MSTDHADVHKLLGAYVLGGLGEGEQELFRAHLAACAICTAELSAVAPLPSLLRRAAPETWASSAAEDTARPADEESLERLLGRVRAASPGRRRMMPGRWLALAAALVMVAALGAVFLTGGGSPAGPAGRPFAAASGSDVVGRASMTPKPWGTALSVDLSHLPAGGPFTLRVATADGRTEQAAVWGDTPAHTAKVTGATSAHPGDIRSLSVADRNGHVLATVRPSP